MTFFLIKVLISKKYVLFWATIVKKAGAILLIILFLFNFFGYRFAFNYLQKQSDVQLQASLDNNNYNEADLLTIKVPLSLPYLNSQDDFERVNGEITIDGKIYKYVKRKISEGNLVLLCLPDYNKMRIESEKSDYFKYANDLAQNNNSKKSDNSKSGFFKNLLSEYNASITEISFLAHVTIRSHSFSCYNSSLPSFPASTPEQPPETTI